jgi:uncharacterized protein
MSERDGYEPGIPCWIDHSSPDPDAAFAFYHQLFGWEGENQMPRDAGARYFMGRLGGRDVAGIGSQPESAAGAPPSWNTYVAVDDADAAAQRAGAAGGTVVSEPFDVFDAGRMAVLQDPGGAFFMVWQAKRHRGTGRVNEPGALTWNELTTRDVDGSKRFYGELLGWRALELPYDDMRYVTWHPGGEGEPDPRTAIGGMLPMEGDQWPPEMPNHWMVYFGSADTDATANRAQELGARVTVPPFDTPAGRIAVLTDPVGATFSVIALAPQQPPPA